MEADWKLVALNAVSREILPPFTNRHGMDTSTEMSWPLLSSTDVSTLPGHVPSIFSEPDVLPPLFLKSLEIFWSALLTDRGPATPARARGAHLRPTAARCLVSSLKAHIRIKILGQQV